MTKKAESEKLAPLVRVLDEVSVESHFAEILELIRARRERVWLAANHELVELYWSVGQYLSRRTTDAGWGKSTVKGLADWLLG